VNWSWIEEILGIKIPEQVKETRKLLDLRNDALELVRHRLSRTSQRNKKIA